MLDASNLIFQKPDDVLPVHIVQFDKVAAVLFVESNIGLQDRAFAHKTIPECRANLTRTLLIRIFCWICRVAARVAESLTLTEPVELTGRQLLLLEAVGLPIRIIQVAVLFVWGGTAKHYLLFDACTRLLLSR